MQFGKVEDQLHLPGWCPCEGVLPRDGDVRLPPEEHRREGADLFPSSGRSSPSVELLNTFY